MALLVDGDNLPASLGDPILAAAEQQGQVALRRVYGAEAGLKGWEGASAYQLIRAGGSKNGTDLLLCIEAVAAACDGSFEVFAVASDDRDFTHLACWLRERGLFVLGLGTAKSPAGWRASCSSFELIVDPAAARPAPPPVPLSETDRHLVAAIGRKSPGRLMVVVGNRLTQAGLRPPNGGTWRAYMATRPDLYDVDPSGPQAKVRWIGP